jgi:cytochrome c oxidase subunit 2
MYFLFFKIYIYKINIIGFKSPATPVMEGIIDLHNYIFFYLIVVFIVVFWMYCAIIYHFYIIPTFFYDLSQTPYYKCGRLHKFIISVITPFVMDRDVYKFVKTDSLFLKIANMYVDEVLKKYLYIIATERHKEIMETRKITEFMLLEIIWTIIPTIILVLIAIPSFSLLYAMDEVIDPKLTVKIIGYQWFWTYEYSHAFDVLEFNYLKDALGYTNRFYRDALIYDSVMLTEDELQIGYHRLLEVDRQLILPVRTHIRLMITAGDVIHSWAVPAFGIKVDAVPGRMNQVGVFIQYDGVFYGQCSELCGVNHGFMPIVVKAVSYDKFLTWYRNVETFWND